MIPDFNPDGLLPLASTDSLTCVRIRAPDDDHLATVTSPDMLDRVKSLLFDEVRATLVVDMRTSPTSGTPGTTTELMDLEPA